MVGVWNFARDTPRTAGDSAFVAAVRRLARYARAVVRGCGLPRRSSWSVRSRMVALENMPGKTVPPRPNIGVARQKRPHAASEVGLGGFEDDVQVVGHDANANTGQEQRNAALPRSSRSRSRSTSLRRMGWRPLPRAPALSPRERGSRKSIGCSYAVARAVSFLAATFAPLDRLPMTPHPSPLPEGEGASNASAVRTRWRGLSPSSLQLLLRLDRLQGPLTPALSPREREPVNASGVRTCWRGLSPPRCNFCASIACQGPLTPALSQGRGSQ